MSEQEKAARTWRNLARRTVTKVNFGWWLDRFSPLLIVSSLVVAVIILALRSQARPVMGNVPLLIGSGIFVLAIGLIAWVVARRRFLRESDGLVRLDDRLSLRNALTTADRGIGKWPEPPSDFSKVDPGLQWNWGRVVTPFLVAMMAILSAALMPITTVEAARTPPSEPLAWAQMEEWMELLEEDDLIEEQGNDEVKEKIEELRNQPEDDWFSHSSLEATDTLRQTLQQQIQNLGAELANAERDLNALQNYSSQLSEETKDKLMAEYDQALKDLALNGLPLNPELMKALEGIDPSQLSQAQMSSLSKEQLDQLRQALKEGAQACSQCNGQGGGEGEGLPALGEGDAALMAMLKKGPGNAGISRGPGPAPLFLGENETNLGTNNIEGVKNEDYSKAAPGDVMGIGQTEHDIDETKTGPQKAGAVGSVGQGGDTVWRESLMPEEKAVLKRYFK